MLQNLKSGEIFIELLGKLDSLIKVQVFLALKLKKTIKGFRSFES